MEAVDWSFLRFLVESHALPQSEWVRELTPELLSWLGSSNTELRDEFAYPILMEVVARDNAEPFLDQRELRDLLGGTLDYLRRERDLRGWVEGLGWAHT